MTLSHILNMMYSFYFMMVSPPGDSSKEANLKDIYSYKVYTYISYKIIGVDVNVTWG